MSAVNKLKELANTFWLGTKQLGKDVASRKQVLNRMEKEFQVPRASGLFERLVKPEPLYPVSSNVDAALIRRAVEQRRLTYEELCVLRDTGPDLVKVFPWIVGFMLPVVGYASPLVAAAYPHLLPAGFWTEATRLHMTAAQLTAQHQRIEQFWLPFASSGEAPALLASLTEKSLDGCLQSRDIEQLNQKLPPQLSDLPDIHRFVLDHVFVTDDTTNELAQRVTRIQYEDELLRGADLGPVSARHLAALLSARSIPVLLGDPAAPRPAAAAHSKFLVEDRTAAADHLKRWHNLPLRTQTSVPHAIVLQHINLTMAKQR